MALLGNEILYVLGVQSNGQPAATTEQTTTGAIAALSSQFGNDSPTAITTTVGTTLPAAALLSGLINRTGPTANFSDTTDTAANIVAASAVGSSFYIDIKNATSFTQTLVGGTGVTFSSTTVINPNSISEYLVTVVSASSVVFNHVFTALISNTVGESITALNTVGAGTITGAGIVGGVTTRGGSQSNAAFTDTTDTAANIITAQPNAHVGISWEWTYQNTTNATATLTGGSGVTVSGITSVAGGMWARFLVTYTAAATITIVGFAATNAGANGTFTANGATAVVVANTNITANSVVVYGLKTVGGTPAGAPFMSAVTAGTGFSVKAAAGDTSVYSYSIIG